VFAGEGNVVERSERYASAAKPDEPKDTKRVTWVGLLGALQIGLFQLLGAVCPEGEAPIWKTHTNELIILFCS
jgi:hypothetical protein